MESALSGLPGAPRDAAGRFMNLRSFPRPGGAGTLRILARMLFGRTRDTRPSAPVPLQALDRAALDAAPVDTVFRLGHSTLLFKLASGYWLTDPVFAERASPFAFAGPRRFHPAPIAIDELPPLTAVLLSHDHYDHLDRAAVRRLAGKTRHFIVPLGVDGLLVRYGVPAGQITALDWWRETRVAGVRVVATPAQHFSGRGPGRGNRTLWASFVLQDRDLSLFFSGDGGYSESFAEIGRRLGPFDMTFIETGAYDAMWPSVHMQPAESLQAHLDLGGRWLFPIHNGTFDLAFHAWSDPFEQMAALAAARQVPVTFPVMGDGVSLRAPAAGTFWWRQGAAVPAARLAAQDA